MITRTKNNYETVTKAKCLDDAASGERGGIAAATFASEDKVYSNDYIIPFHAVCSQKVTLTQVTETVDDKTCQDGTPPVPPTPAPIINGANNITVNQGIGVDLRDGVTAMDGNGNPIDFTVSPATLDKCGVGVHDITYTATADGQTTTVIRKVTISQITNPTFTGLDEITVAIGEEFDELAGVTATDGNGNSIPFEVIQ